MGVPSALCAGRHGVDVVDAPDPERDLAAAGHFNHRPSAALLVRQQDRGGPLEPPRGRTVDANPACENEPCGSARRVLDRTGPAGRYNPTSARRSRTGARTGPTRRQHRSSPKVPRSSSRRARRARCRPRRGPNGGWPIAPSRCGKGCGASLPRRLGSRARRGWSGSRGAGLGAVVGTAPRLPLRAPVRRCRSSRTGPQTPPCTPSALRSGAALPARSRCPDRSTGASLRSVR